MMLCASAADANSPEPTITHMARMPGDIER
jgi:hypothetical protein